MLPVRVRLIGVIRLVAAKSLCLVFESFRGFLRIGNPHRIDVEGYSIGLGVAQDRIVRLGKVAFRDAAAPVAPYDLVPVILFPRPENGVHDGLEIMAGRVIAVQIDRAGRLQYPVHFHQAHRHETQERAHAEPDFMPGPFQVLLGLVHVDGVGGVYDFPDGRPVILNLVQPCGLHFGFP